MEVKKMPESGDPIADAALKTLEEFRAIKGEINALPEKERLFVNTRVDIAHLLDKLRGLPGSEEMREKIADGLKELEHNLTRESDIKEDRVSELVKLAERKYQNNKEA